MTVNRSFQSITKYIPALLVMAIALYPFTASWEYGLGYYLYAIPLVASGVIAWFYRPQDVRPAFFKWLIGYGAVAAVVSLVYVLRGYTMALRYPLIYVVVTLGVFGFWSSVRSDRLHTARYLRHGISLVLLAYLVFWLVRDYALGEYYAYPCRVNQFAFWSLFSMILLDNVTLRNEKTLWHWVVMLLLSFLAITTLSRAATLGVVIYWASGLVLASSKQQVIAVVGALAAALTLLSVVDFFRYQGYYVQTFADRYQDLRLLELDYFLRDRGYNKVISNPALLLVGSAEGTPERFGDKVTIHNTLIGPWFNYGVIGLVCLLGFIKSTWRPTKIGWRIAIALVPVLMFHDITHMFLPYFLLVAIALTPNDDKVVSIKKGVSL